MIQGTDHRHQICQWSKVSKMLTNLKAGRRGRDRRELTPDFARCIGFWVQRVKLTWPTPHEQQ